ncbi:Phage integrase family protein [Shimia marina]|uniref:Prophage CP4-57 integrase n=2 Tax=Shimia marina TaxID=321267 RepID=A0A0P1EPJ0_9RHOB|nr:Prophage CP4-57 integrase [Shimia marina]SFE46587.1 Phage integrase family protein [Shimia marina]
MRDRYKKALSAGQDPKAVKDVEMSEALAVSRAAANVPTLESMRHQAFEAIRATLKESAAHRWMTPLRLYVHPTIGNVPITQIDQHVLHDCLKPVWRTKHPSAVKALRRVNIALKHATAAGLDVDLQAAQKAKIILGEVDHEEVGRPSLHYRDAPHFYAQLPNDGAALLLKALMLTGVRSAEMRLARIEKIEWNEAILTSPREIVKGRKRTTKDNRIALSSEAVRVLRCAAGDRTEGHIFRNIQRSAYSDNAVSKLMRDSNWLKEREIKATPHGMRSTFKAFILERHHEIPPHIVELVLSHTIENKVGAAYTRTDQIEQQRCALERWGRFLCGDKTPVID